jgi:hypothetical protein
MKPFAASNVRECEGVCFGSVSPPANFEASEYRNHPSLEVLPGFFFFFSFFGHVEALPAASYLPL